MTVDELKLISIYRNTNHYENMLENRSNYLNERVNYRNRDLKLTLFRMSLFGAAHGWGEGNEKTASLKSVTHIIQ